MRRVVDMGDPSMIQYASEPLRRNKDMVLRAATAKARRGKGSPFSLRMVHPSMKADRDVVLATVRNYPLELAHASKALQDDPSIVMEAVMANGHALEFASAKCKNDPELVLQAVTQAGSAAMHHASDALKNQNKFVLFATVGLGDQDLWVHISDKLGADDDVEGLAEKVYDKNGGDPAFNALVGKPPGNGGDDPSDVPVALSEYDDTHS